MGEVRAFKALPVVLGVFLFFSFLPFKKNPAKEFTEVYKLIASNHLKEAEEKLKVLEEKYPGSRETKELRLILCLRKGLLEEAQSIFQSFAGPFPFEHVISIPSGKYVVVCDKREEKLYVIRGTPKGPELVDIFPCITGKREGDKLEEGDQRTPEGVYFALRWIDGKKLPPIYGYGAFVLNYPNLLDKSLRKDGHGIWIHGTNDPGRPPHSSNGCIVVRNGILKILKDYIRLKETPIVIVEGVRSSTPLEINKEKKELLDFLERWRKAWENTVKDLSPYFSLYSNRFISSFTSKELWMEYKRRITRSRRYIKVDLDGIYVVKDGRFFPFGYIYVASFNQRYISNNYRSFDHKVLYIIKEGGSWRILGEEVL